MYLTFDWDDMDITDPIVEEAMSELNNRFGYGNIWYRVSSSGDGLHIILANLVWKDRKSVV